MQITTFQDESGKDIVLDDWFTVATTKFISGGGDGCTAWKTGELLRVHDKIADVVIEHVEKQRILSYAEKEYRLVILE